MSKLNSTTTTVTVPLQFLIILAGVLSILFILILICFTGMILKNRKKRKLNRYVHLSERATDDSIHFSSRYGEKLILQTGHHDNNNQLKLQIPCCNNIEKDTQSSSKLFRSFPMSDMNFL